MWNVDGAIEIHVSFTRISKRPLSVLRHASMNKWPINKPCARWCRYLNGEEFIDDWVCVCVCESHSFPFDEVFSERKKNARIQMRVILYKMRAQTFQLTCWAVDWFLIDSVNNFTWIYFILISEFSFTFAQATACVESHEKKRLLLRIRMQWWCFCLLATGHPTAAPLYIIEHDISKRKCLILFLFWTMRVGNDSLVITGGWWIKIGFNFQANDFQKKKKISLILVSAPAIMATDWV